MKVPTMLHRLRPIPRDDLSSVGGNPAADRTLTLSRAPIIRRESGT